MSGVGQCPGCGSPLEFRVATSVVAVCSSCQQVVARGGVAVFDLGKSNPVLVTHSALSIGASGTVRGRGFTVVGRCQLKHVLGGIWNEWYALLDNNKWTWIAEHQGRICVMGEVSAGQAPDIRSLDAAQPGSRWLSGRGEVIVAERGIATLHAEEGELPWRAVPNERRAYVDLSAAGGAFSTLDLGSVGADERPAGPRRYFVGFEIAAADLAIRHAAVPHEVQPRIEGAQLVKCPRCSAPLELKRPEDTMTIVCGSCGSALAVEEDQRLGFLFAQTLGVRPRIPLGARARLAESVFVHARPQDKKPLDVEVVAFIVRSVVEDGETFFFYEYLLATKGDDFRWLVESDGGWQLFQPIATGAVTQSTGAGSASYQGANFARQSTSTPKVEQVMGELYWRVLRGDTASASDYQRNGGFRLSVERTADEVNWTYGFGVPTRALEQTFLVKLPRTVTSSMGSPYASSEDSGDFEDARSAAGFIALAGLLLFCVWVVSQCDDDNSSSGGGHGSYGGGGGTSFGK